MANPNWNKGVSGNPDGRPKGALNKETVRMKEAYDVIMELLEARMTNPNDVMNNLSAAKAAELYKDLVNFKKAKLNKNDNNNALSGAVTIKVKYTDEPAIDDADISPDSPAEEEPESDVFGG